MSGWAWALQIAIGIIVTLSLLIQKGNREDIKKLFANFDALPDRLESLGEKFKVELDKKQDVNTCKIFHEAHKDLHAYEKASNDTAHTALKKDIDGVGAIARRGHQP